MLGRQFTRRGMVRIFPGMAEAVSDIPSGSTLAIGGFGFRGIPDSLTEALSHTSISSLSLISCDPFGLTPLLHPQKTVSATMSYIQDPVFQRFLATGKVRLNLTPMGTLIEKLRAGGSGIPGFYTKTGAYTWVEEGKVPRLWTDGKVAETSDVKETREFNGKKYLFETSLTADFGFVRAWKADKMGNLVYRNTAKNFNPLVAMASKVTIAEVDEIGEVGCFRPEEVHTPGVYVHRLVLRDPTRPNPVEDVHQAHSISPSKFTIARRAARELLPGMTVNLGIGIPTLIPSFLDASTINIQSENGLLGMGPPPKGNTEMFDLVNAGRQLVTMIPGASLFDSAESFAMIRGGHIDVSILGGFQVSAQGDLANWTVPGRKLPGIGGGMDLANSGSRIIVLLTHCSEKGESKLVEKCKLPLTGKGVVKMAITEKGVFRFGEKGGPVLEETAKGVSLEEMRRITSFNFSLSRNFQPNAY